MMMMMDKTINTIENYGNSWKTRIFAEEPCPKHTFLIY